MGENTMDWLKDAMREKGLEPQTTARAPLRSKLLSKADRMLAELDSYSTEAELDGNGVKFWWGEKSVNGQRRLVMRDGGKVVDGSVTYVENTVDAVREGIAAMRDIIANSTAEQWAEAEAARRKQ